MRKLFLNQWIVLGAIAAAMVMTGICPAQTVVSPPNYIVSTQGGQFKFDVNGKDSGMAPGIGSVDNSINFSLYAGASYIFNMNTASDHPVDICTSTDLS